MNIILSDDISNIIWKSYYSNYVIQNISSRKESKINYQEYFYYINALYMMSGMCSLRYSS